MLAHSRLAISTDVLLPRLEPLGFIPASAVVDDVVDVVEAVVDDLTGLVVIANTHLAPHEHVEIEGAPRWELFLKLGKEGVSQVNQEGKGIVIFRFSFCLVVRGWG